MPERTSLDRIRDDARDELSPEERELLARELAADPELAELASDFRMVHALTARDSAAGERSGTSFSTLAEALDRAPHGAAPSVWPRKAAAALIAASLVIAAGTAWRVWSAHRSAPLVLNAIDLQAAQGAQEPELAELPSEWADYDPRGERGVEWLRDVDQAALLARAVERPLLVFGFFPQCPMCKALDADVFTDTDVRELAERFVPIRFDLSQLPEAEAQVFIERGFPFLEAWCQEADRRVPLDRAIDADAFEASLREGLTSCAAPPDAPSWAEFHDLVRLFDESRMRLERGEPARADHGFRALAERSSGARFFAELAASGLRVIARDVGRRYLEARARAQSDPAAARSLLLETLELYAGTAFEPDLRATAERLERDGRFPAIAAATPAPR
jgi:hypothetical protein